LSSFPQSFAAENKSVGRTEPGRTGGITELNGSRHWDSTVECGKKAWQHTAVMI